MGELTDRDAALAAIGREAQDAVAVRSHQRASAAMKDGRLADEIVPVATPQRRGEDLVVGHDEGVRPATTAAALAALKPAFGDNGTITAGNASQLSDGAAVVIMASRRAAEKLGIAPLAEVVAFGRAAGPGPSLLVQPAHAIVDALGRCGLKLSNLDVIEVNEAFAVVVVASAAELGVPVEMLNPNGGAIALGHPIGMSGCRLPLTLALELRRRGGGTGVAALCGGGGLGDALVLRAEP